jgi:hypothetical protein
MRRVAEGAAMIVAALVVVALTEPLTKFDTSLRMRRRDERDQHRYPGKHERRSPDRD